MARATTSLLPPGVIGTMNFTGLAGKVCATTAAQAKSRIKAQLRANFL